MSFKRTFISFDYEHDEDLRNLLAGQALFPDSPFELKDRSIKEPLTGNWKEKVRRRMDNIDLVIVLCGQFTHTATGVSEELKIARDCGKPYFLLWGRKDKLCTKPLAAGPLDKIYEWTWPTLKKLIDGER